MKRRLDTLLLAAGLFSLSCAVLCYNLAYLHGDELKTAAEASKPSTLSYAASKAIESGAIEVSLYVDPSNDSDNEYIGSAEASALPGHLHEHELLPPIVTP